MDSSARAAAFVRVNELDEPEIDRRAVLHMEKFQEREGREMTDREFNDFLHRWEHGSVTLDPRGNEIFSQPCCLAASVMETIEKL